MQAGIGCQESARDVSLRPAVEDRLLALAHAGGPLRRLLAALAGRLTANRSWEPLGYARLSDYARERLGVSARWLQELARVEGRLAALPELEAALLSGRLPWSKVRLVARAASAESEAALIAYAVHTSVRELERSLRSVDLGALGAAEERSDEEGGSVEPTECVRLRVPRRGAFLWHRSRRDAARQAAETTPPAQALEWVTAEVRSWLGAELDFAEQMEGDDEALHADGPASGTKGRPARSAAQGRATTGTRVRVASSAEIPAFLKPLLDGLEEASPHELDARLRRVRRIEQRIDAEIAALLRHVTSCEYEWRDRCQTRGQFARECLGMSPRKARALVSLDRAGDRCPELRRAFRSGALSWAQAQLIVRLVVGGAAHNEALGRWVEWAQSVSVRELEEAVGRAQLLRDTDPARWEVQRAEPEHFASRAPSPETERQTCARPTESEARIRIQITASREVAWLFHQALCAVRLAMERATGRLPSEGDAFEVMLCHALATWETEDPWLRQRARRAKREYAIFERDGWRCSVPGCSSRRNLQAHHIVFRSAGGSDDSDNLTTLCAFHHLRGVHAGRVRVRGQAPDGLRFDLGVHENGPPLVRYRSGDRVVVG